jgi:hypothetical protein
MPRDLVPAIEGLRIATVQPMHPTAQLRHRRLDEQVNVVAHQAVRETTPRHLPRRARQQGEISPAIQVVDEDRPARGAAREDVVEVAGQVGPRCACHHRT